MKISSLNDIYIKCENAKEFLELKKLLLNNGFNFSRLDQYWEGKESKLIASYPYVGLDFDKNKNIVCYSRNPIDKIFTLNQFKKLKFYIPKWKGIWE